MTNQISKKHIAGLLASLLCATPAFSSGYHFGTQSVSSQSTANASSAEAADASTIFYNAAGLTKLEGTQFSINANVVAPSVKYSNAKGYYAPYTAGSEIAGSTSGKITNDFVAVPHLYASHQLNDSITLGLGVFVPFATESEYQRDSVMRYNVNQMGLKTIAINPNVAFKINDNHSIALGFVGQHSTANLRQYANFGGFAGANGAADGFAKVKGSDWGFGYNLGYLWDINEKARLGISYRSKISHTLKGSAKWDAPAQAAAIGYVPKEDASVNIVTPESLSVHGMVKFDDKWTGFGDVTWTRHSRFDEVNIKYENNKAVVNPQTGGLDQSNVTTMRPNWKNTFKIGIGASYQYSDNLQLRFGVAFDKSPATDPTRRLTTLPDNDRIWLSLGAKYDINKNSSLNVAYSYIHIKDSTANVDGFCGSQKAFGQGSKGCVSSRTTASADFKNRAQILGIQYNYRF
ncbi:MAG: transporter [Gammaproteobacteria bacterium]|nr:transporter [Gammaproteobacteria bacterium]